MLLGQRMSKRLSNTNRFYLPGTQNRALHLATIIDGLREYICFAFGGQIYIEEITGGVGPFRIEEDQIAEDIHNFLTEEGVLDAGKPLLPDNEWLRPKRL